MFTALIAALLAPSPLAASARTAPACTPGAPIAAPFAAWRDSHPLDHGFVVGRAVDLPAVTVATVRLAIQPSKSLTGDYLATAGFEVKSAGRYSVAVGGVRTRLKPLWLDLVRADGAGADRTPLKSVGHGHGPDCSSITKVVEFDLQLGTYTLLATGLATAEPVRALVIPVRNPAGAGAHP